MIHNQALDIEWLQTEESSFILQVRPLAHETPKTSPQQVSQELRNLKSRITSLQKPHPYLAGETTIFGVMPDWNPAELIGIRPNTLAFSLFRELISDSAWAYERSNLGYRNLRSFPLVLDFAGQPFVDLRISLNSLIPASVSEQVASQLANYYLKKLIDNPTLHDKVEFEVVLSCYTFDWDDAVSELQFLDLQGQESLKRSLIELTRNAITGDTYGLKDILKKQEALTGKFDAIDKGELDPIGKAFWFLEDCKRHGTLPFAGIARLAFIATKLLDSLVRSEIVTEEELHSFTSGLETRTSKMVSDQAELSSEEFLKTYGHLRPGTFDVTVPRYSDAFDLYFPAFGEKKLERTKPDKSAAAESFITKVRNFIPTSGLAVSGNVFIDFCRSSIVAREESKFIFSRHVSATLEAIADLADSLGFSRTKASHISIQTIKDSYKDPGDLLSRVSKDIFFGEKRESLSHSITLPTLIRSPEEVSIFRVSDVVANFVTLLSASGEVVGLESPTQDLYGKIVVIASADPGFDWIFTRGIAGMITAWGGANSHMSIRAKELQIPSAIGVGEKLYLALLEASSCRLDCRNKKIEILS
jgi:phosphohistidine swiveling domain-containing protein